MGNRSLAHALGIVSAALLGTSCVEAGSGLFIVQNQIPTVTAEGCVVSPSKSAITRPFGQFDVALNRDFSYMLYPILESHLPTFEVDNIEQNRIDITGYQIKIDPPPGIEVQWSAECPPRFDFPGPALLQPGDSVGGVVEGMRACHSRLLRGVFESGQLSSDPTSRNFFKITVRAKGRHGSTEVISDAFEYPVQVCYGCLQVGLNDPMFPELVKFNFPNTPLCSELTVNPYTGNPCNPAQDSGPLLCCANTVVDPMTRQSRLELECPGVPRGAPVVTPKVP